MAEIEHFVRAAALIMRRFRAVSTASGPLRRVRERAVAAMASMRPHDSRRLDESSYAIDTTSPTRSSPTRRSTPSSNVANVTMKLFDEMLI